MFTDVLIQGASLGIVAHYYNTIEGLSDLIYPEYVIRVFYHINQFKSADISHRKQVISDILTWIDGVIKPNSKMDKITFQNGISVEIVTKYLIYLGLDLSFDGRSNLVEGPNGSFAVFKHTINTMKNMRYWDKRYWDIRFGYGNTFNYVLEFTLGEHMHKKHHDTLKVMCEYIREQTTDTRQIIGYYEIDYASHSNCRECYSSLLSCLTETQKINMFRVITEHHKIAKAGSLKAYLYHTLIELKQKVKH
jgi:hypothetical protein